MTDPAPPVEGHTPGRPMSEGAPASQVGPSLVEPVPVSPLRASVPSAVVVEHPGDAVTLFTVRAGWDWASVFVRPINEGAEVVINSSFGTYGYVWGAMGCGWREFLPSLSREYAMRKLAGRAYDVPLDREEFIAAMRDALDDDEKSILDSWGVLDPDRERRIATCRDALDEEWGWKDVPLEALFWHFNEQAGGVPYEMELYEVRMTKINPQVVGFWDIIFVPFCDHLAQGTLTRSAETEGLGPKDGGPLGDADAPEQRSKATGVHPHE